MWDDDITSGHVLCTHTGADDDVSSGYVLCTHTGAEEPLAYSPPRPQVVRATPPSSAGSSEPSLEELMEQASSSGSLALADCIQQMNLFRATTTAPHPPLLLDKIFVFQGGAFYRVDEQNKRHVVDRLAHDNE
ncbi:MAG: hypothetical protein SGARI_004459, partial [Bacillariaceae sp.]